MTGRKSDLSLRASEQILMVSLRGTLVNKLDTSKEHIKTLGSISRFCLISANAKESDMQYDVNRFNAILTHQKLVPHDI